MDKVRDMLKTIAAALGWGMLGGMMLATGTGPEWFGWLALVGGVSAIAGALDKALTPARRW